MTDLCQYVDVCISNEEDAKDVFGIEAKNTNIYGGGPIYSLLTGKSTQETVEFAVAASVRRPWWAPWPRPRGRTRASRRTGRG